MKKSDFIAATKGMMNSVRVWQGFTIAHVGWQHFGWKLVMCDATFRDAVDETPAACPLQAFHTREDLWNHIKALGN